MKKPALLLLPNLLSDQRHHEVFLPASVDRAVVSIDGLIAESERGGRRYLSHFDLGDRKPEDVPIAVFQDKGNDADLDFYLEPIRKGERWGLVSDAGLPCVADPGARLVYRARQLGIALQAFIGPSATMLSLMLSGLSGQSFAFRGYPAKDQKTRRAELGVWQAASKRDCATQIFIEAPHRNRFVLEDLLDVLDNETRLCVAWALTTPDQGVITASVKQWKNMQLPNLDKKPTIFLFSCS